MRLRSVRLLLAGMLVGVPILTLFVRRARSRNRITPNAMEDFTPEQTAFLRRVRETWDAVLAGHDRAGLSPS